MQHFVIIVCAPNLQHAKHTVTFCFSLKMASAHGRQVSCACSFTKWTLWAAPPCSSVPKHVFSGSWWLMALECLWSVSLTMFIPKIDRISSEYWVQRVPLLLFLSFMSYTFSTQPEKRIHSPCVFQLMNCQLTNHSPWWKRDAHIHQLSHYITAYKTESRKWITGFNKEETGLINTPTFMQSKIQALPQHAIEIAPKCCNISKWQDTGNNKEDPVSTGARCHAGMSGVTWSQAECNGGELVN